MILAQLSSTRALSFCKQRRTMVAASRRWAALGRVALVSERTADCDAELQLRRKDYQTTRNKWLAANKHTVAESNALLAQIEVIAKQRVSASSPAHRVFCSWAQCAPLLACYTDMRLPPSRS